jgi:integrase
MDGEDRPPRQRSSRRASRLAGEGTVYQDKRGQWWASIGSGRDRKTVRCPQAENTERKARQILRDLQRQREAGIDLKAGRVPLTTFATTWLNEVAGPNIKAKSFRFYQMMLENYILPELGDMRLDQIRPEDVQRLLNDLRQDLSDQTVRHVHAVGKRALNIAVKWGYIVRNPFALVDPPRVKRTERVPLTPAQMTALRREIAAHRLAPLYELTLLYGYREGEVLGLRWTDVGWETETIKVAQQVQTVGGTTGFETPKTERSTRILPASKRVLALLRPQQRVVEELRTLAGTTWKENDLIFPSQVGTPIQPRNLVRHYKAALKRAGIPTTITFHDLRHTAATRLSDVGAPQSIIAAVLGHAIPGITGIYTHVDVAAMRPWLELVEARFFNPGSDLQSC